MVTRDEAVAEVFIYFNNPEMELKRYFLVDLIENFKIDPNLQMLILKFPDDKMTRYYPLCNIESINLAEK